MYIWCSLAYVQDERHRTSIYPHPLTHLLARSRVDSQTKAERSSLENDILNKDGLRRGATYIGCMQATGLCLEETYLTHD